MYALLAVAWSDRLRVLEPYEVKVSSPVLRGRGRGNATLLPDYRERHENTFIPGRSSTFSLLASVQDVTA